MFEGFRTTQESGQTQTPEKHEKEVQSTMFKGLLAVGVGALWAEWNGLKAIDPLSSGPSEENSKLIEERGFLGATIEKTKSAYTNLQKLEKFLDPDGEVHLMDIFEKIIGSNEEKK